MVLVREGETVEFVVTALAIGRLTDKATRRRRTCGKGILKYLGMSPGSQEAMFGTWDFEKRIARSERI